MTYNRTAEARQLLTEIEAWCARTDTREGSVGHVLFLHPGFVGLLRLRLTVSVEKEIAVREFIYATHPDGYRGVLPLTHANGTRPVKKPSADKRAKICLERGALPTAKMSQEQIAARRVHRDPCQHCGARGDFDCGHSKVRLGMIL